MVPRGQNGSNDGGVEHLARELAETLAAIVTPLPGSSRDASRPSGGVPSFDLSGPRSMLENGARHVAPLLPADAPARRLKALLLRALRIVTRDQTTFNSALLEALRIAFREIEQAVDASRRSVRAFQESSEAALQRVEGDVRAETRALTAALEEGLEAESSARERLGNEMTSAERRIDRLESEADRRGGEVDRALATSERLAAEDARLEERLRKLDGELRGVLLEWTEVRTALKEGRSVSAAAAVAAAGAKPALDAGDPLRAGLYVDFEEAFRGSEEEIGRRQQKDVALFRDAPGPVADLGCGRGEFLAALGAAGISAIGCDANAVMVARGRDKGLPVDHADLFAWLAARGDGSLGGITAYQVVEHLVPADLFSLVELALRKLAPGGRLLLETVNAESVYAMKWFWMDLSHVRPVPAGSLAQMLRSLGFRDVVVDYRSPVPESEAMPADMAADPRFAPISRLLFAPQDVAVTGLK